MAETSSNPTVLARKMVASVLDTCPGVVGLIETDGTIIWAGGSLEEDTGFALSEVRGVNVQDLLHPNDADAAAALFVDAIKDPSQSAGPSSFRIISRDGETRWMEVECQLLQEDSPTGRPAVSMWGRDITAEMRDADRNMAAGLVDERSGLATEPLFIDRLTQLIAFGADEMHHIEVIHVDLGLDETIKLYGPRAIEAIMPQITERMKTELDAGDTAGVLKPGHVGFARRVSNQTKSEANARTYAATLTGTYTMGIEEIMVEPVVGIATGPSKVAGDAITLMHRASMAADRAKRRKTHSVVFNDASFATGSDQTTSMLKRAVAEGQLRLHYQPIVHTETRRVVAIEALIRWSHPEKGLLNPLDFLEAAERSGMIIPLGAWVLQQACEDLRILQMQGFNDLHVSANVSPTQVMDARFKEMVYQAISKSGVDASRLNLELTEGSMAQDSAGVDSALNEIAKTGVNITIDDFGVASTPIRRLRAMTIGGLKLHRDFCRELEVDNPDLGPLKAMVATAHALELDAMAIGVETDEQLDILRELGCQYTQGYLFSPPIPIDEVAETIRELNATPLPEVEVDVEVEVEESSSGEDTATPEELDEPAV